jgi:autotransporter-associated beta strand protein
MFVAESLGSLMQSGYSGGFVWDLRNGWNAGYNNSNLLYGWRAGGDYGQLGDTNLTSSAPATGPYVAYPGYYALQLASKIITAGGQLVPAASSYGDLDVYAAVQADGDLDLLVINTNPAAAITDQFEIAGLQPAGPAEVWQYGETQDTAQSLTSNGASALSQTAVTLSLSGGDFSYAFPAYSMTVLDLETIKSIVVAPGSSGLVAGHTQQFSATALNQLGDVLPTQPAFTWSLIGNGSLTTGGLYTPPYASGTATIEATSGTLDETATVTFSGLARWVSSVAASWTAAGDWEDSVSGSVIADPGLRGAVGDTVLFAPSAAGTVELNGASPSLGAITFQSGSDSTIAQGAGGSLLLSNGASPATVTVAAGADTISAPLALESNVTLLPAAGSQLTLSGGISGPGELSLDGPGTVILGGAGSYAGSTAVSAGTLVLTDAGALPAGSGLVIGGGGTLIFNPTFSAASGDTTAAPAAASAVSNVKKPASIVALDAVFAQPGKWWMVDGRWWEVGRRFRPFVA